MHFELPSPPTPYAHPSPLDNDNVIGTNQCLCLPKGTVFFLFPGKVYICDIFVKNRVSE